MRRRRSQAPQNGSVSDAISPKTTSSHAKRAAGSLSCRRGVERAFQLCYGRRPTLSEMSAVKRFFGDFPAAQSAKDARTTQRQGWAAFCQALFQAAEFRMID